MRLEGRRAEAYLPTGGAVGFLVKLDFEDCIRRDVVACLSVKERLVVRLVEMDLLARCFEKLSL